MGGQTSRYYSEWAAKIRDQTGKVVAITGCTSGTGYVAALTAAKKGAHVVMLNRQSDRQTKAMRELQAAVPEGKFSYVPCDLTDFASVRAAAEQMKREFPVVDALLNNAGVMMLGDYATKDGYDVQMQTNHFSHFLLTKEIWPLLKAAADKNGEARVVNHSSKAREGIPLDQAYFEPNSGGKLGGNTVGTVRRYHESKLANVVFTLALHDELKMAGLDHKIKALACAPGGCATNLSSNSAADAGLGSVPKTFDPLAWAATAEDGALSLIVCGLGTVDSEQKSGEFYEPSSLFGMLGAPTLTQLGWESTSFAQRPMLWQKSEEACGVFKVA